VSPNLTAERRVVVERVLLVGAQPVAETPIAEDPTLPARGRTSNVVDLRAHPSSNRPLAWIPLGRVREGGSPLAARLVRLAGMVIVADAETDADLDALIEACSSSTRPAALVGAAGLALALARRLGLATARVDPPAGEAAGSSSPAASIPATAPPGRGPRATRGLMVLATPDAPPQADRAGAVAELVRPGARPARRRAHRCRDRQPGGETLVALYHRVGAERLDLEGAPRVRGLALGRAARTGPRAAGRRHQGRRLRRAGPLRQPRAGRPWHEAADPGVTMGDPAAWAPRSSRAPVPSPPCRARGRPVVIGAASAMSARWRSSPRPSACTP